MVTSINQYIIKEKGTIKLVPYHKLNQIISGGYGS